MGVSSVGGAKTLLAVVAVNRRKEAVEVEKLVGEVPLEAKGGVG